MLNNTATQKPLTEKPLITEEASSIINPFITKVNKPKVKMFIGRVISNNNGLIKIFTIAKKTANHNAVQIPANDTPGIR